MSLQPLTPEDVVNHFMPRDAVISPDSRRVAYWLRRNAKIGSPELPGELWLADVADGASRPLTSRAPSGQVTDQCPRWSPDSRQLLFLSNREAVAQRQIYVLDPDSGTQQRLTSLQGHIEWPIWSPDGREITFAYAPKPTPLASGAHVADADASYLRVYSIAVSSGTIRTLTPDRYQVHEFAWSPDGNWLAVIATADDATPSGWFTAQLYVVAVQRGNTEPGTMQKIGDATRQITAVCWSPDSNRIAYLTSIISDQPLWQGDVCIADVERREVRQITAREMPMSITKLDWLEPDRLLYSARHTDGTSFGWLDVATGKPKSLWFDYATLGDWTVPRISASAATRTFATILERPDTPPQVWVGSLDSATEPWKQISKFDYPTLSLGRMEVFHWTAPDGLEIAGHIVYPADYQPGKPYPMFVQIHGGPAWSWLPHYAVWWEWWHQYLASRGYLVFLPNVRGSSGRGTAFTEMNVGDLGGGDWQDVLSGVDQLVKSGLADPARLGLGGWSYGGFMAAWAVSQTTRFKVIIMGAGITNWESYYAQNSIRDWQRVYFGSTPYEDPAAHRARSPLTTIQNARTPTLIFHGENDQDVSLPQAYEMYVALRTLGVDTQLVTYPGEKHPVLERSHQIDLLTRVADWCDHYMLGKPVLDPALLQKEGGYEKKKAIKPQSAEADRLKNSY
jgi:dipeptidyl aminopeptidase/acylaminoacyl peptidase